MLRTLTIHPDGACPAVQSIAVEATRPEDRSLSLRYGLTGDPTRLLIPPPASPERADELWRHTCFEAFLAAPGSQSYYELNLSPSRRWAAYRFDGYRQGQAVAPMAAPRIALETRPDGLELTAELDLEGLADLPARGAWRLGLSAVIEQADGRICYWALAHPPGRPDFHHADCLAGQLVAPQRA
jgi:hypothetical protein